MPLTGFSGLFLGRSQVLRLQAWSSRRRVGPVRARAHAPCWCLTGRYEGSERALRPTQQAILRQTFPEEQGMAMAMFAMVIMVGPAVGPTLGGYRRPLLVALDFYINLPIGVVGTIMTLRCVHEPEDVLHANRARAEVQKKNLDIAGIVAHVRRRLDIQYVLEEGQRDDWFDSPLITTLSFVAGISLVAFVIRELRRRRRSSTCGYSATRRSPRRRRSAADVRDVDGEHVPLPSSCRRSSGSTRPVGVHADAAHRGNDGDHPLHREALQPVRRRSP